MNRRNFIKVVGAGTVAMVALPHVTGLGDGVELGELRPALDQSDIRMLLLSYAMLAPNPHNTQAWKVHLMDKNTLRLFVDETRLLPETDPIYRQIHVGQGCFIENLVIAATQFSIRAEVEYFPQGSYDNQSLANLPVADIRLVADESVTPSPLFKLLTTRQSNKTVYGKTPLPTETLAQLTSAIAMAGFGLDMIDAPSQRQQMEQFLVKAMEIEESKSTRTLETISMFRFNDEEFQQYRDGFGLPQNGINGIKRVIAESFFLSRESAEKDPVAFGKESVKTVKKVVLDNPHYALLISDDNSRLSQVKAGRMYCRLNLVASRLGVSIHPMSQILQEYEAMLPLQAEFKRAYGVAKSQTVQMLFRVGKADPTPPAPRRDANDIVVA
ncbi:Acg family FMN-binding oxidoreductase [Thaumasiovibrio subtropicus]|uniref:Acg family FMN-binding oxidoreductase n=1 Tax=Thaumasiovibrio subtropicus TaxID=1891207 RepID=UPI001864418B|nr:twin-arginine translocation signal domain-containing protein [Thaumasiovibrio subtropicus]